MGEQRLSRPKTALRTNSLGQYGCIKAGKRYAQNDILGYSPQTGKEKGIFILLFCLVAVNK
jgi:hypothetical protein